jgi:hypothetical protein
MRRAFLRTYGAPPQVIRHRSTGRAPLMDSKVAEAESDTPTVDMQRPNVAGRSRAQRTKRLRPTKLVREGHARRRRAKSNR